MTNQPDIYLDRPGSLIAALPAVLGFVPEKSLVLVTLDRGELGCVMRVDLSSELAGSLSHLAEAVAAAVPGAAIAVIVDEEGATCRQCNDDHRRLADMLTAALAGHGIELLAAHVVDKIAADGRWHCADGCGNGGTVEDPSASPMAVAAVLDGRRLYPRRADLQQVVEVDPVRAEALSGAIDHIASQRGATRSDDDARRDVEAVLAIVARIAEQPSPSDAALAASACALTDGRVRDTLYALAVGREAGAAESLWAVLARSLPGPWRVEALVLLAFSAYARGDGPLAGVSLEAALGSDPKHRMAGMLDSALHSGIRPEQIRELALTGYRMAGRLGVELPARQVFGRRAG